MKDLLLLSLDFETTGLDSNSDRITEVGYVLYSTGHHRPMMAKGYFVDNEVPVSKEITDITGITKGMIDKFGLSSKDALTDLLNAIDMCDAVVGQNIIDFDRGFLVNWVLREKEELPERLWIDTKTDLPGVEPKHLGYMAADAGFLNPFPHQAISDCMTVLKLVDSSKFTIEQVVERAKSPRVTLQALVSFDNKDQAKKHKYQWDSDTKVWHKTMKELDVEDELKKVPFKTQKIAPIARKN